MTVKARIIPNFLEGQIKWLDMLLADEKSEVRKMVAAIGMSDVRGFKLEWSIDYEGTILKMRVAFVHNLPQPKPLTTENKQRSAQIHFPDESVPNMTKVGMSNKKNRVAGFW